MKLPPPVIHINWDTFLPFAAQTATYKIGDKAMTSLAEMYRSAPARYPELLGKVAIVTGSSRGIGAGIAARLAREGMRLVMTGLDPAETEASAASLRGEGADTLALAGDLGNPTV